MMAKVVRMVAAVTLIGVSLAGCGLFSGRDARRDTPPPARTSTVERITPSVPVQDLYALTSIENVTAAFQRQTNQAGVESTIDDARRAQFSDLSIAESMGTAWLHVPAKRVMISVAFVRFKDRSTAGVSQLDEAYEMGRTPPAQRAAAAAPPVAEVEEEEPRPRQRGWRRWVPGL